MYIEKADANGRPPSKSYGKQATRTRARNTAQSAPLPFPRAFQKRRCANRPRSRHASYGHALTGTRRSQRRARAAISAGLLHCHARENGRTLTLYARLCSDSIFTAARGHLSTTRSIVVVEKMARRPQTRCGNARRPFQGDATTRTPMRRVLARQHRMPATTPAQSP
jgi:hypothetical protein